MNGFTAGLATAVLAAGISGFAIAAAAADDDVAAKGQVCSTCHGAGGTPVNAQTPIIWGQQSDYLYKQLHDYHSGARPNATMAPLVQAIALPDLRALADYFAGKPWPPSAGARTDAPPPAAIAGKIEMCKACHQAHFEGGAPGPRLAGLSSDYLLAAMNGFADGSRTNNLDMPGFMKVLSESDRAAIAHYLAGL